MGRIDLIGKRLQETEDRYWDGHLNALYAAAIWLEGMDEDIIQRHIGKYTYPELQEPLVDEDEEE